MNEHPLFKEWAQNCPREAWAMGSLRKYDPLRDRIVAAVVSQRVDDPAFQELTRFADALEFKNKADQEGTREQPPARGERRSFEAHIIRFAPYRSEGRKSFRVDFTTPQGWSGYFDTTNPKVVEQISKLKDRSHPITLVGEIDRRMYDFLVVLGGRVRIV
jgi:hypothetical protein